MLHPKLSARLLSATLAILTPKTELQSLIFTAQLLGKKVFETAQTLRQLFLVCLFPDNQSSV